MFQTARRMRQNGRWVITVNQIAVTVVVIVVVAFLTIAAVTGTERSDFSVS